MDVAGRAHPAQPSQAEVWGSLTGLPVYTQAQGVADGIVRVHTFLIDPATGEPRLFFDPRCKGTIREFGLYKYAARVEGREAKEEPIKVDDHAMDALRYGLVTNFGLADVARSRHRNIPVSDIGERV